MASGFDLSDLLTASGNAMGLANRRLAATGAPALLQQVVVTLDFNASFQVAPGDVTLLFGSFSKPNAQLTAMMSNAKTNSTIEATFIAAPSLVPVPPT
jgi:hypothetical protein